MPESPDFEQMARPLFEKLSDTMDPDNAREMVLEQLRRVWNARGAADIATLETVVPTLTTVRPGAMKTLDAALRALDR
jgi:hypothetical protein